MPVDERSRHQLFSRLEEVLGPEDATTLIEHLPPVGWADVTTKRDLDALELRLDQRFVVVDQRIDHLSQVVDERFSHQARSINDHFEHQATSINQRFARVDEQFARVDEQFARVDEQFARVDERGVLFEQAMDLKLGSLKNELLAAFRGELNNQLRTVMFGMVTIVLTMATLAFALARFA